MEKRKRAELLSLSLSSLAFFPRRIYSKPLCFYRVNASRKSAFLFFPNEQKSKREVLGFYYLFHQKFTIVLLLLGEKIFTRKKRERETKENETRFHDERKKRREKKRKGEEEEEALFFLLLFPSCFVLFSSSRFSSSLFLVSFFCPPRKRGKGEKEARKIRKILMKV